MGILPKRFIKINITIKEINNFVKPGWDKSLNNSLKEPKILVEIDKREGEE